MEITATKRGKVQDAILEAAREVFARQSFDAASIRDIATLANVNHAMIKYYFQNKETLWKEVVNRTFTEYFEAIDMPGLEAMDCDDVRRLEIFINRYVHYCARHPLNPRLMMYENLNEGPRMQWVVETYLRPAGDLTAPLFYRLHKQGRLPKIGAGRFMYLFLASIQWPYLMAPALGHAYDIDLFTEEEIQGHVKAIMTLFLKGDPEHPAP